MSVMVALFLLETQEKAQKNKRFRCGILWLILFRLDFNVKSQFLIDSF